MIAVGHGSSKQASVAVLLGCCGIIPLCHGSAVWSHTPGADSFSGAQTAAPTHKADGTIVYSQTAHTVQGKIRRGRGGETMVVWFLPDFSLHVQAKLVVRTGGGLSLTEGIYGNQGEGSSNRGRFRGKRQ